MSSLNKVILIGNLTRDPELKYLPSGTAVCDMGLAINEKYKNSEGDLQEKTVFVDVVAWKNQAETCSSYLTKGSLVMIEGGLQLDQWKTKEGENRSKLKVCAQRVQFMDTKKDADKPTDHQQPAEAGDGTDW